MFAINSFVQVQSKAVNAAYLTSSSKPPSSHTQEKVRTMTTDVGEQRPQPGVHLDNISINCSVVIS